MIASERLGEINTVEYLVAAFVFDFKPESDRRQLGVGLNELGDDPVALFLF